MIAHFVCTQFQRLTENFQIRMFFEKSEVKAIKDLYSRALARI